MNRKRKIVFLGILLVFATFNTGCGMMLSSLMSEPKPAPKPLVPIVIPKVTTQKCHLSPFKTIIADGDSVIELRNGDHYRIEITGIYADSYNWKRRVRGKKLYLINIAPKSKIKLTVPEIKNIATFGNVKVTAKKFKSKIDTLVAKDNSSIDINGQLTIFKLLQYGTGRINIGWLDCESIFVTAYGCGPIYLYGAVDEMGAKLVNNSYLNARYLRTKKITILAAGRSQAEVVPVDYLDAYATDHSNVYYYKWPKEKTVVTKGEGNVLQAGWDN